MIDTPPQGRRIGVMLPRDLPAGQVLAFARAAENAGLDELWVVEDLGFRGGIAQAASVLAVTERIAVGVGILPAAVRNVAYAAMEIATLEQLHPGRLIVGIGHGMPGWMRRIGVWPASPLTLLDEYVRGLRALLAGTRDAVDGRYVRTAGLTLEEHPAQLPPLLLGVRGPRSLELAGRVADGAVLAEPAHPAYLAETLRHLGAQRTAEAAAPIVVAYDVAAVADTTAAAVELARPALAAIGDPDWWPHIAPLPFADELRALREGAASAEAFAAALPEAWIRELAIVGTPTQLRAAIAARHHAGATTVVLTPVGPDPLAALHALAAAAR